MHVQYGHKVISAKPGRVVARTNELGLPKKKQKSLGLFLAGFILFTLFYVLSFCDISFLSGAVCQAFQGLGLIMIILGAAGVMKFKFDNNYLRLLFSIFLVYSIVVVLRGAEYDFNSLKKMLLNIALGILPYFTPLVVLFPRNIETYKKIFSALIVLGILYFVFVLFFFQILRDPDRLNFLSATMAEISVGSLAFPVGFVLLTYIYHTKDKAFLKLSKWNLVAVITMMIALYFMIYKARRGAIFMCGTTIAAGFMVYFIYARNKAMMIFLSVVFVAATALFFAGRNTPAMFNFLLERGDEDTRTGVEEYMAADMSSNDWIFGKGYNGKYFCPNVGDVTDLTGMGYRDIIETGYLQIILTSGLIGLGLLVLILVPAVFLGLFKSKNVLSKAAAIWIFLWIVYEYPTVGVAFTMHYILVWISVGICYSAKIRNMPDFVIRTYLQRK